MQLFSSSPKSQFSPFFTSQNPNPPKFFSKIPIKSLLSSPLFKSTPFSSKQSTPSLDEKILIAESDDEDDDDDKRNGGNVSDGMLVVRRPVMESSSDGEESENSLTESEEGGSESAVSSSSSIDQGLSEFAKKMPIFEPERVDGSSEKPLPINLELALYRAKVLARNFRYEDAEKILRQCISFWPEDGRPYVSLGKILSKQSRYGEARSVYEMGSQATQGENPYIWQAWAQLEMQQENNRAARQLFEKAVQASPKNRFAWHVWAIFEANLGDIEKGRKLLKIGHALNPRDPVLLQSLALLEYKHSSANLARVLFRRASELDPRHQPVWIAWGWVEWKEGNIATARELYQRALSINSTSESAARCLQAWGVLEQRLGNMSAARRLFRSSLNINSQSYITWQTWASLEEEQGNAIRAEEIRNLYFQQRTEVVDDASWVMGFLDIIDPALDSIKKFLNMGPNSDFKGQDSLRIMSESTRNTADEESTDSSSPINGNIKDSEEDAGAPRSNFDLDAFIKEKLSLDASKLDAQMEVFNPKKIKSTRRIWKSENRSVAASP
ncbi:protein high chlorophyll fluorescent 107 isoform X2 [Magnolia sinica]|uniref:protein high chlorophyll fluorescent 107 isoform X2 n=1 Tax=Magnolia sinica TaxID=86752 RepID=UPI00265AE504|nr:protein high chlorophyll fluorescent 107 isoform X2 [Magnolia sinica]